MAYIDILSSSFPDYELLDSGNGKKLERFGKYILIREEPRAWLPPTLPQSIWDKAHAEHDLKNLGGWQKRQEIPDEWIIEYENLKIECRLTAKSKHVGIFPEQASHWSFLKEQISKSEFLISKPKILNLFGYTGISSLAAASAGAEVTHVDASKGVVDWAHRNAELSGLLNKPIRWIVDDAGKFVEREIKRGKKYDGIILDPPTFGRGPGKQLWRVETHLLPLLQGCAKILSDQPRFIIISMYAIDQSAILLQNLLKSITQSLGGTVQAGELVLKSTHVDGLLPMSIVARWKKD